MYFQRIISFQRIIESFRVEIYVVHMYDTVSTNRGFYSSVVSLSPHLEKSAGAIFQAIRCKRIHNRDIPHQLFATVDEIIKQLGRGHCKSAEKLK